MTKTMTLGRLLSALVLLTGCSAGIDSAGPLPGFAADYAVGLIRSSGTDNASRLDFFRADLSLAGSRDLPWGSLEYLGFNEPVRDQDQLFLNPKGLAHKKDAGIVVQFDLTTGAWQSIDFGRINITSTAVTLEAVFAISNFNGITALDRWDRSTHQIQSILLTDQLILHGTAHQGELVVISQGRNRIGQRLVRANFTSGEGETLAELNGQGIAPEAPIHLLSHQGDLYLTRENQLLIVTPGLADVKVIDLPSGNAGPLQSDGDRILILHADIVAGTVDSALTIFDPAGKTVRHHALGHPIWQVLARDDTLWGLDLAENMIHRYSLRTQDLVPTESFSISPENGWYNSALFLP